MRRLSLALALLVASPLTRAADPGSAATRHEAAWRTDVAPYLVLQERLERLSGSARDAALAELGLGDAEWDTLDAGMRRWLATAEGFAAARKAVADDLVPVEGVSLDRFALANAMLVNGLEPQELLTRLGIDESTWERIQAAWSTRMRWDRSGVVTALYTNGFLSGLEGRYRDTALDAAAGVLPGGTMSGPEPISFERFVEIQTALAVGVRRGLDPTTLGRELFGLSFADWVAISSWWGVVLRGDSGAGLAARGAELAPGYDARYDELLALEPGGLTPAEPAEPAAAAPPVPPPGGQ